eukprot:6386360-Alexandrium_andersonii.AAC.1
MEHRPLLMAAVLAGSRLGHARLGTQLVRPHGPTVHCTHESCIPLLPPTRPPERGPPIQPAQMPHRYAVSAGLAKGRFEMPLPQLAKHRWPGLLLEVDDRSKGTKDPPIRVHATPSSGQRTEEEPDRTPGIGLGRAGIMPRSLPDQIGADKGRGPPLVRRTRCLVSNVRQQHFLEQVTMLGC